MHIFNRVIVICIGNICRSPMAAAVLQDGLAEQRSDIAVASAGLGRVYRLGHWENFNVDDSYQHGERAFRKALRKIDAGVIRWLEIIAP
jgi:protein-tyrosine phosphatase